MPIIDIEVYNNCIKVDIYHYPNGNHHEVIPINKNDKKKIQMFLDSWIGENVAVLRKPEYDINIRYKDRNFDGYLIKI